jgi:hypothetical protein
MFGIIGSGFGLYGHLPAIALTSEQSIYLPLRYRTKFESRNELDVFKGRICWVKDEIEVMEKAENIILSVSPILQEKWISQCVLSRNTKTIILEKPLASTPIKSIQLLEKLIISKKNFRINYTFLMLSWFDKINMLLESNEILSLKINWKFLAHHYKHNVQTWKREISMGGGVMRFFGIHFIAVISALEFYEVVSSNAFGNNDDDAFKWEAEFKGKAGATAVLNIDSKSNIEAFNIEMKYLDDSEIKYFNVNLIEPFGEISSVNLDLDSRTEVLQNIYSSILQNEKNEETYTFYKQINNLWLNIEKVTNKVSIPYA